MSEDYDNSMAALRLIAADAGEHLSNYQAWILVDRIEALEAEIARLKAVNEHAQHELVTLHGLYAHDGHPEHEFQIDTSGILAEFYLPDIVKLSNDAARQGETD